MHGLGDSLLGRSRLGDGDSMLDWGPLKELARGKGYLVLVQNRDFVLVPAAWFTFDDQGVGTAMAWLSAGPGG